MQIFRTREGQKLELYSSNIFCWWYRQLIIVILAILSVIVEQCNRNNEILMCGFDMTNLQCKKRPRVQPQLEHNAHACTQAQLGHNAHACTQPQPLLLLPKIKTKQDDGDVFCWIFGHVSLLKLNILRFKATFSVHKLIPKNAQITTLYTNCSLYITFTMIYYIRQE